MVQKTNETNIDIAAENEKLPEHLRVTSGAAEVKTKGDTAVSVLNEVGLNWLFNSALSITMTLVYNKLILPKEWVQTKFKNWAKSSAPEGSSPEYLLKVQREKQDAVETGWMLIWGTLIMFPYKAIRDHSQKIAYKFDKKFEEWGWQKKGTAAAKAEARGETMDKPNETRLSWGDLIISRIAGMVTAIFSGVVLENHASGKWFSKMHPAGKDTTEKTDIIDSHGEKIGEEEKVLARGKNFRSYTLKAGNWFSRKMESTALGQTSFGQKHIRASTDEHILKPSTSEEFVRLTGKELALTGILATTMPVVLGIIDRIRGKDSHLRKNKHIKPKQPAPQPPVVTAQNTNAPSQQVEEKQATYAEKNKPVAANYTDKAIARQEAGVEQTL